MLNYESIAYAVAATAFGCIALMFWLLWQANIRGSIECQEAAEFLEKLDSLEDPVDAAVRYLRLPKEDIALEMQKGQLLKLVGMKIASTAATLRSPIPIWKKNRSPADEHGNNANKSI